MALRTAQFGNRWTAQFKFLKHRNLSGQLRTARRSVDRMINGFEMTSIANSETEMLAFRTTFLAAAGTQTTYTDFEGRTWTGFFLSDSLNIKRGRAGCTYSITFKFEGTYA